VFQNKLFEVQESPFMRHFLSDLNEGFPGVFGCEFGAIGALTVLNEILDLEGLFKNGICQNLITKIISENSK